MTGFTDISAIDWLGYELATPVPPKRKSKGYPVEIKDAGVKGKGVFATRDIYRGEVCCWYDGIKVPCWWKKTDNPRMAQTYTFTIDDPTTGEPREISESEPQTLIGGKGNYGQMLESGDCIAGFRSVFREGGCAQLCNDATNKDISTFTPRENDRYNRQLNVQNEEISGGLAFTARRRIKKGEELLYMYGEIYWSPESAGTAHRSRNHTIEDIKFRLKMFIGYFLDPFELTVDDDVFDDLGGDEPEDYLRRLQWVVYYRDWRRNREKFPNMSLEEVQDIQDRVGKPFYPEN